MPSELEKQNEDAGLSALQDALRVVFLLVRVAGVLLLLGFCLSGIRNIEQFEKAVVLRFGSLAGPVREDPGMIFALPYPIDNVVTIPAKRTRTLTTTAFNYVISDQEKATGIPVISAQIAPGKEGALVTADGGLLHAEATVKYRINDPVSWQFETADSEPLLKLALERAMIHAVSTKTAQRALQEKADLQRQITREVQAYTDRLRLGIEIDPIELTLSWPRQLDKVINDVISARSEADSARNEAQLFQRTHANETDSKAAGMLAKAKTEATRVNSRAKAEAATFKELQPLYRENPELVRRMVYQERIRAVISGVDEVFVIDGDDQNELRLSLPRDGRKPKPAGAEAEK